MRELALAGGAGERGGGVGGGGPAGASSALPNAQSGWSQQSSSEVASHLLAESANAHLLLGDYPAAEASAQEAVSRGRHLLSEGAAAGLMILSDLASGRCEYQRALDHAQEAVELTERRAGVLRGWRPEIFLAMALRGLDRFEEADAAIQRGRLADEERGHVAVLPVYG